ncbi:Mu transposase C-terminal domain-containing protein [Luteibacter sahnii]|uniref:Mu transposase C-terminal domain-containing protein n=1 Tax=Luteibacter sahnii TaxID=3021977 RepID=UPI002A757E22|nr:Mu transposase C-terminal domain-containing protein [Luteibacter sp. PPL193]MDY1550145.1 DDE-type integrase/transposase/recombinase [Luteibacter sp. PPL193]
MATGSFQVGQRYIHGDSQYRLTRPLGEGAWVVENMASGAFTEERSNNLLERWSNGELEFTNGNTVIKRPVAESLALERAFEDAYHQSYPDTLWNKAVAKLVFVRKLEGLPITSSRLTVLIREIWEKGTKWPFSQCPHFTTVARWIRTYRAGGGDIRALIDQHVNKGNKESRLGDLVESIADDVIETVYMTLERRTIQDVLEIVRARVSQQNLGRLASEQLMRPSFHYVSSRIKHIPAYDRWIARYGKRLADIKFRASGLGAPATRPLERACIDHCRLDLMVVDEESRLPLGRPWLTLVLDEATRYVLGYYIGFEEPSAVSVARAVRNALMPKTDMLAAFTDIANSWEAWGIFSTLVTDNGLELHGSALEQGIERFGIRLQFCPRKKPWYKGKIERFFGTFSTKLLSAIPGKTFLNTLEKADYDPSKHAVISLATLRHITLMWIVDIYHRTPHRGLGATPANAWEGGIVAVERWLPASSLEIESAFSRSEKRRLTHKGIEFDCLLYNSPDLARVREKYGAEINVDIRVSDDDIGHIVLVVPGGRQLINVPALEQRYAAGMTRWQHLVCKRYQRRILDDEARDISLLVAKEKIRDLISADMRLTKKSSRKRQARFMEKPEDSDRERAADDVAAPMTTSSQALPVRGDFAGHAPVDDVLPILGSRRVTTVSGVTS